MSSSEKPPLLAPQPARSNRAAKLASKLFALLRKPVLLLVIYFCFSYMYMFIYKFFSRFAGISVLLCVALLSALVGFIVPSAKGLVPTEWLRLPKDWSEWRPYIWVSLLMWRDASVVGIAAEICKYAAWRLRKAFGERTDSGGENYRPLAFDIFLVGNRVLNGTLHYYIFPFDGARRDWYKPYDTALGINREKNDGNCEGGK